MPDGIKLSTPEAPQRIEKSATPESPKEGGVEVRGEKKAPPKAVTSEKEQLVPSVPMPVVPSTPQPVSKTQLQLDIEDILADDMKELYLSLSPEKREQFKKQGEKTAAHIEVLLKSVKVKISEILHLIRTWLSILPGINTYFLEKEVKIKTEQILELKEELTKEE